MLASVNAISGPLSAFVARVTAPEPLTTSTPIEQKSTDKAVAIGLIGTNTVSSHNLVAAMHGGSIASSGATTDTSEAQILEEYREVEAQAVFLQNGKISAIVYRDGTSVVYGDVPPGFQEFCENQVANGGEGAIERATKLAELYGDTATVLDYSSREGAPLRGYFMDMEIAHPEMYATDFPDIFTKGEDKKSA